MEIDNESTKEKVADFLFSKYGITQELKAKIIQESIDGEALFELVQKDLVITLKIKAAQAKKIFEFIKANKDKLSEKVISETITSNSDSEEVKLFFKKCIEFNGELNNLDGKQLLELTEEDSKKLGLNLGQRKKLIKYINYFKTLKKEEKTQELIISESSSPNQIIRFLKEKVKFSEESIKELKEFDMDGNFFFSLDNGDIDEFNIKEEEKAILKEIIEKNKENKENNDLSSDSQLNSNNKVETKNYSSIEEFLYNNEEPFMPMNSKTEIYYPIKDRKIENIITNAKYNIFFNINFDFSYYSSLEISTCETITSFMKSNYNNYKPVFLNEYDFGVEKKKYILIQVPLNKYVKKLSIKMKTNFNGRVFSAEIENNSGIQNFFYIDNLFFKGDSNRIFETYALNQTFIDYMDFFFDERTNKNEYFQRDLTKAFINKIEKSNNSSKYKFGANELLRFFKYCVKYQLEVKKIDNIELKPFNNNNRDLLKKEFCLSNEDIVLLSSKLNDKETLINLFVDIYANYDKECLIDLIQSKNGKDYCSKILKLLIEKTLKISDLSFNNMGNVILFQKNLLDNATKKDEINIILKLSENLTKCLEFIVKNYQKIYSLLDESAGVFAKEEKYCLTYKSPKNNEDIDTIFIQLNAIKDMIIKNSHKKILNFDELFNDLLLLYSTKTLEEIIKLHNIVKVLQEIPIIISQKDNLYQKIHEKGMNLIATRQIDVPKIIVFIKTQDIYYYNSNFKNNINRDPSIFRYIPITDNNNNKEYHENIKLIKQFGLYNIFDESDQKKKISFYRIVLEQVKKVMDFKSIFELFPIKKIDENFVELINSKMSQDEIKHSCLYEKKENYNELFKLLKYWLEINYSVNEFDLAIPIKTIQLNYDFTSKYYFYLLHNEDDKVVPQYVLLVKNYIIDFFIEQTKNNSANAECLIFLLLFSPNKDFSVSLLNKMNYMIMKEKDFYNIEINEKFRVFQLFLEQILDLMKNETISEGEYFIQTMVIKNKILNDLNTSKVPYNVINNLINTKKEEFLNEKNEIINENIEEEISINNFYKKILVIVDKNEEEAKNIFKKLKKNLVICKERFKKFKIIEEYYNTFYQKTKKNIIKEIKKKLDDLTKMNIDEIINLEEDNLIDDETFDLKESVEESKKIKYKNSFFFMTIYREILENGRNNLKSEDIIFNDSLNNYKKIIPEIINQKASKKPFFEIDYIKKLMKATQNKENNLEREIDFIKTEFKDLGKDDYINNDLINDLINFSFRDKLSMLLKGIKYFIEVYNEISEIEFTDFKNNLEDQINIISSNEVNGEEIKKTIDFLKKYEYDIKKEKSLFIFYELLYEKKEAIKFIKKIKEANFEIRNLNEFIDESENKQLDITDIDNLIDVYSFFIKLMNNENIKTDEDFLKIFGQEFIKDKTIIRKLQEYLKVYGEIIQLFKLYDDNPVMTIQKINKILQDSKVDIYKEVNSDIFSFNIIYIYENESKKESKKESENELEELRNKLMMSSGNSNVALKKEDVNEEEKNEINKKKVTKEFISLIDNIKHLIKTLNNLVKSGYPNEINVSLRIENSQAYEENNKEKNLQELIKEYKNVETNLKNKVQSGYENFQLLKLFYGKQFIQLWKKSNKINEDISHLVNSVTQNNIKNYEFEYEYNQEQDNIENINNYLEQLFKVNNVKIEGIYNKNKVLENIELKPGLYRKIKGGEYSDLLNNILNIYFNITGNSPILNTLLICNEDTNIEQINAFLYRAIYCEEPILFIISNMECLEFSLVHNLIKTLKRLYKSKNKEINSYLIFIYEKKESGLVRYLEKLIPEKNILKDKYLQKCQHINETFDNIELYSSEFSGYGKTTEIIHKVKDCDGKYYYLPIGGSFSRNYVINNLYNLNIDKTIDNKNYLHLDLSETDDNDLMNEVLFKLIFLKYIDSEDKIFYIGYDINLIIEIPTGFVDFKEKFIILDLFNKVNIEKLGQLRLEEGAKLIKDSPISIVAEVLSLYDKGEISKKNIDLDGQITKTEKECEEIINKYFVVENQNYYQKINFIKILSVQFKKFTENPYFNYEMAEEDQRGEIIANARKNVIRNFIELTKVFTQSPFDKVLLKKNKSLKIFNKYDENEAIEDGIKSLANEKQEIFSFTKIKPSLVFFNRDGGSISIISNNNKDDLEYKELQQLWNSQNADKMQIFWNYDKVQDINPEKLKVLELVDYKNLNQKEYLEQIKILFSLDSMQIEDLQKICQKLGNFVFVSDNFIKMVRILLNIEAKIPVILMGETGVGKTLLLEMLTLLYGKGTRILKKLQIHAGITDKHIVDFIEKITEEVKNEKKENEIIWIFFDEINTCNSLGLITEIMCHHTYLGKKINDNFVFLGACNPYRYLTKKMKESGLVYYNLKDDNKLNNLVYTVNPLPHSLLNFVFDFASLQPEDEKKYIANTIMSILSKIQSENLIPNISKEELESLKNEIIESIEICHDFLREKYDRSTVSLREIGRFRIFFEYFLRYFNKIDSSYRKMHTSLNITLYLCYYLRINDKNYRKELNTKLNKFYTESDFITEPEIEIKYIANQMVVEKEKGIALNRALRENLFTCFMSIVNNVPLIIVGKPGTGKSLSFQILYNSMKGKHSESELFKNIGKLYRFYYQGSETSTAEGIEKVFSRAKEQHILSIKIYNDSSKEEVEYFLKNRLKFSEKSTKILNLNGKELFKLKESDIDKTKLTNDEKENLKQYLKEEKEKEKRSAVEKNKKKEEEEDEDEDEEVENKKSFIFSNSQGEKNKDEEPKNIPLVFFDEMGLAERSSNNPLKIIHFLLEKDEKDSVRFLGISNWRLDASKINRALNLSITDYDVEDLQETAISIASAINLDLSNKYKDFFETLAKTYSQYVLFNQNTLMENKNFHGNRDFYNLIKVAMKELIDRKDNILDENRVLTEVGKISLDRNFGGLENSSSKIKEIFKKEFGHKYEEDLNTSKHFSVLEAIKKNILDPNSRYLMLICEENDGSDIIKYLLDSIDKNYIELIGSKYKSDIKSGKYSEEMLNKIKYIMEKDNILILRDLNMIYASLYDLFNQNFTCMGDKRFARIAFEYAKISSEVNKDFHTVVIVNNKQIKDLKLDPPFLNRFEKHIVNFENLLEEKDIEIAKKIYEYISLIASFNDNPKLKLDLEKLFINCKLNNIEGLIFKIKNEQKDNEIFQKENPDYEINIFKNIFKYIAPTFCQDIIASLISSHLDHKYDQYNEIVMEIYKNSLFNNLQSFLEKIEKRKNIVYTFSKITENLFKEDVDIKNKYGVFNKQTIIVEMIDSIKSEKELKFLLESFMGLNNKNLLILRFSTNDLNKMISVNYVINNLEKENPILSEKLFLFVVHMKRYQKGLISKKPVQEADLITFINDEFYQIFIDNLHGKESSNILTILQKKEDVLANEYLDSLNFVDNKIFTVLNYMNYKILFQTKDLNDKNYINETTKKIIENKYIKELINNNLKKQGKFINNIISKVFTMDIIEINDIDFFEVINSRLSVHFCECLLNIIFYSLKENILNPALYGSYFDSIAKLEFFKKTINSIFEKEKFNNLKLNTRVNGNKITIYNGLEIPKSKNYFDKIVNYTENELCQRYNDNEGILRKNYLTEEKIIGAKSKYNKELDKIEENLKNEINKNEFFEVIDKQENEEIKKLFLQDYLKYYVIKSLETREVNYQVNERILNLLTLIIKSKFSKANNQDYTFENSIEELIKIILFTQGYKSDINILFEAFIVILKYCDNIEEYMKSVLGDDKVKYVISDRNKKYTQIVNINLYNIIESFLRGILLFTKDLLKKNKQAFDEFFFSLPSIEANIHKINKKFYLYSIEIYNLRTIIKIKEVSINNTDKFEQNYEKIINNLIQQSDILYNNENYNNLFDLILELHQILDETFEKEKNEKNEDYINLKLFIYKQQYRNIYNEEIRTKLLESIFKNNLLLKKSTIFLTITLKDIKPEVFRNRRNEKEESFINNFMNISENKKLKKYQKLIEIYNNINSEEFNEILLYFLENQCHSYFTSILNNYNNQYTNDSCKALLLSVSLGYLKKSIQYLYEHKNNNDNNLLKLFAIAYLKTYCYYYVEINYKHFDLGSFDEINLLFKDNDKNNELIRNMRNIYIWRLYYKQFENFEQFQNFNFDSRNIPIYKELMEILKKEDQNNNSNSNYIFKESFISIKSLENYNKMLGIIETYFKDNKKEIEFSNEDINLNFDNFYCLLINKIISYLYCYDKNTYIERMSYIYQITIDKINLLDEGKILYKYLLNNNSLENEIFKKISNDPLSQDDFEILLYSFRFVLGTQSCPNKCFYNDLLKEKTSEFVNNNFIPGSFPSFNEFVKSYNYLEEVLPKRLKFGYYICKDCGYLYEVPPCSFPTQTDVCPNGHVIGGIDHICSKMDIRVFFEKKDDDYLHEAWNFPEWHNSFVHKTLEEYKKEYVEQYILKKEKGIINNYRKTDFVNNKYSDLNIITFRILNFILYSYLNVSYIIGHLSIEEMQNYLVESLFPFSLFGVMKNGWELLDKSLKEMGIENIQTFLNMTFNEIIEIMKKLESGDTQEKVEEFEKEVDEYIKGIMTKENIEKMNKEYTDINNKLINCNPQSMKEIIQSNYDPSIYDRDKYPDIQYYSISKPVNLETFKDKFNLSEDNIKKYALINLLINRDSEMTKGALKMECLNNINKFENILLNKYSYKISRENAKKVKLRDEIKNIIDTFNEINSSTINDEDFIKLYIDPFIESWNRIKDTSVQYGCQILRDLSKGETPFNMSLEKFLSYFLVDVGDKDGGMFLASAYLNFIDWQNKFINDIISKNKIKGILNSYVSQLQQEILIQDSTEEEILKIDGETYKKLDELIASSSMRNIFGKNNKIDYNKYNDIIYDYDNIEEEMAKEILPKKKRFKQGVIKFIIYLYEEFRGNNSSVLVDYNSKYVKRDLTEEEKANIIKLIQANNNSSKFFTESYSSLQILMNQILKENYDKSEFIYNIIKSSESNYNILHEELINLFKDKFENKEKIFTIDCLVSILEYFEDKCWDEIKKNIPPDYKLELSDRIKDYIIDYFEENKNKEKIINKKNITNCLRKLLSRYIAGAREEAEIKSDTELKLYINKEEFWNKDIDVDSASFNSEILEIFKYKITSGQIWDLYNLLEGDNNLKEQLNKDGKEQESNDYNELNGKYLDKDDELRINREDLKKEGGQEGMGGYEEEEEEEEEHEEGID